MNKQVIADIRSSLVVDITDDMTEAETVEVLALSLDDEEADFERSVRIWVGRQESV